VTSGHPIVRLLVVSGIMDPDDQLDVPLVSSSIAAPHSTFNYRQPTHPTRPLCPRGRRTPRPSHPHHRIPRRGQNDASQVCPSGYQIQTTYCLIFLRRILTENHGHRIAVIMNEFADTAVSLSRSRSEHSVNTSRTLKVRSAICVHSTVLIRGSNHILSLLGVRS
jgi:hypothetical protein